MNFGIVFGFLGKNFVLCFYVGVSLDDVLFWNFSIPFREYLSDLSSTVGTIFCASGLRSRDD